MNMNLKIHFHLPSISCFKEPATQDKENARNKHAQQVSPPPDLQPANTQRRNHQSSRSWLKKLNPFLKGKKSGLSAQSTFTLGHPIWNAISMAEKQVAESITQHFSQDALKTGQFKITVQDCIDRSVKELDEKFFDDARQNLLPGQSLDIINKTKEYVKKCIIHSAHDACYALHANEIARIEGEAAETIAKSLSGIGKDTLTISEFENMVRDHANLDHKFDHILQNLLLPGESSAHIKLIAQQAKERIDQTVHEACRNAGWAQPVREASNIAWEPSKGPFLIKQGLSLQQLKLDKADIANGTFGSVSIFENENGDKLIGKISKDAMQDEQGNIVDDLAKELDAYQTIYEKAGCHPNLVNAYGIAQVPKNGEMKRTLLMDAIPGQSGEKTFDALSKCWDAGKISSEDYWRAMQFIGRRLLDVTEHLGKANVVHNDIKPENFMVNEQTGEPVLIDFGIWSQTGSMVAISTLNFMSPEVQIQQPVNEKNDVFTVGASLLHGVEKQKTIPNQGIFKQNAFKDQQGNVARQPGTYAADTAYTHFMNLVMARNKRIRPDSKEAKQLDFLDDTFPLGGKEATSYDDAAKEVIKKVILLANEEAQKPAAEQWKPAHPQAAPQVHITEERMQFTRRAIDALRANPNLHDYANLWNASQTDPRLKAYFDGGGFESLRNQIEEDAAKYADNFLMSATWFSGVKWIMAAFQPIKSGVDVDGLRLDRENKTPPSGYGQRMQWAKTTLPQYANIEDLRTYANTTETFLRDVGKLEGIRTPWISQRVAQLQECAALARHAVEIFGTDLPASGQPVTIQERAQKLEPLLKERLLKRRK